MAPAHGPHVKLSSTFNFAYGRPHWTGWLGNQLAVRGRTSSSVIILMEAELSRPRTERRWADDIALTTQPLLVSKRGEGEKIIQATIEWLSRHRRRKYIDLLRVTSRSLQSTLAAGSSFIEGIMIFPSVTRLRPTQSNQAAFLVVLVLGFKEWAKFLHDYTLVLAFFYLHASYSSILQSRLASL